MLMVAACRVGCGRIPKVRLHTGDQRIQSKVKDLVLTAELSVQDAAGLILKAEESALETRKWTSKSKGEDWKSSKEAKVRLPSFPFHSIHTTSLLVGTTHMQGGFPSGVSLSFNHTQNCAKPSS